MSMGLMSGGAFVRRAFCSCCHLGRGIMYWEALSGGIMSGGILSVHHSLDSAAEF